MPPGQSLPPSDPLPPPGMFSGDSEGTAEPTVCAACGGETLDGVCVRCGLAPADIDTVLAPARRAYERARQLAEAGRFGEARTEIAAAIHGGLGDHAAVLRLEELCREAETVPPEPAASAAPPHDIVVSRSAVPVAASSGPTASAVLWFGMGMTLALATVAIVLSVIAICRPQRVELPLPSASSSKRVGEAETVAPVSPIFPPRSGELGTHEVGGEERGNNLPPDLRRGYEDARRAADEQIARRWLNEGLAAFEHGDAARAETLADAAYAAGSETYLADDALLLAARAADNRKETQSPERWARIADLRPDSPYAATGLKMAARAAHSLGRERDAETYLRRWEARGTKAGN